MMSPLLVQDQGTGQSVCPAEFEEFAGEVTRGRQGQGEERTRAPHQVELATIMTETWITDLTHVLTVQGAIAPPTGPARRFAERLTRLVAAATAPPEAEAKPSPVPCWRRPGRRRCAGVLETALDPATGDVVWGCPVCGQQGRIHHWQGSRWDGMARGPRG